MLLGVSLAGTKYVALFGLRHLLSEFFTID